MEFLCRDLVSEVAFNLNSSEIINLKYAFPNFNLKDKYELVLDRENIIIDDVVNENSRTIAFDKFYSYKSGRNFFLIDKNKPILVDNSYLYKIKVKLDPKIARRYFRKLLSISYHYYEEGRFRTFWIWSESTIFAKISNSEEIYKIFLQEIYNNNSLTGGDKILSDIIRLDLLEDMVKVNHQKMSNLKFYKICVYHHQLGIYNVIGDDLCINPEHIARIINLLPTDDALKLMNEINSELNQSYKHDKKRRKKETSSYEEKLQKIVHVLNINI